MSSNAFCWVFNTVALFVAYILQSVAPDFWEDVYVPAWLEIRLDLGCPFK